MEKRISGGFDLRTRIDLQVEDLRQRDQYLIPEHRIPISADPWIWDRPDTVDSYLLKEPESYPMGLRNNLRKLLTDLHEEGIVFSDVSLVCLLIFGRALSELSRQFGESYFADAPTEGELLASGWRFLGFDVVELNGLTSGLKGIGYREPLWTQLKAEFGSALNDLGLFGEERPALQFAEIRGKEIPEHAPFDVVGLLVHDPFEPNTQS